MLLNMVTVLFLRPCRCKHNIPYFSVIRQRKISPGWGWEYDGMRTEKPHGHSTIRTHDSSIVVPMNITKHYTQRSDKDKLIIERYAMTTAIKPNVQRVLKVMQPEI
jgi:hypothetical protein